MREDVLAVLLNWIWQGSAMALVALVLLRAFGPVSAGVRYRVWWVALVIVLLLPLGSGAWSTVRIEWPAATEPPGVDHAQIELPLLIDRTAHLALWAWATWVAASLLRLLSGVRAVSRLRAGAKPFPLHRLQRLPTWRAASRHGRSVALAVSDETDNAAAVGIVSPLIVVAPRLLEALTDDELDRVLVHEWAHVQRRDDLLGAAQLLIRIVVGWHPGIWWIDRQLCIEREAACDETVVDWTGSPKAYAACLAKLAGLKLAPRRPELASGALGASAVSNRVTRVLEMTPHARRSFAGAAAALALPVIAVVVASLHVAVTRESLLSGSAAGAGTAVVAPDLRPASGATVRLPPMEKASEDGASPSRDQVRREPRRRSLAPATPAAGAPELSLRAPLPLSLSHNPVPEPPPAITAPTSARAPGPQPGPAARPGAAMERRPDAATPWGAAAEAGTAVARASEKAAVSTASFFSKLGKRIAGTR